MDHMQFLVERASDSEGDPSGHALMITCPPEPEMNNDIPFGHGVREVDGKEIKTWDVSKTALANLLDISQRFDLDGEITPVMAWGMVLAHPRFSELSGKDFEGLIQDLGAKVRCYG